MHLPTGTRTHAAATTLRRIQPLLPAVGISRLTDITRLDRLGLPVCTSIRPRGRLLRVHAGKGPDPVTAQVGAAMEALELAAAEIDSIGPPGPSVALGDLRAGWPDNLQPDDFAPNVGATLHDDQEMEALPCELLGSGQAVRLPAELVRLPRPGHAGASCFSWSSNGLASGNTVAEATLHALLELLERDALAMNAAHDQSWRCPLSSLPDPVPAWAAQWLALGVELIVRAVPNVLNLPCFEALLVEEASADVNLATGSGLHPLSEVALMRAVTEAAQSRLSTIHGGRDDLTRFYAKYTAMGTHRTRLAEAGWLAQQRLPGQPRPFHDANPGLSDDPDDVLQWLLRRLLARGFPYVFRHRLHAPGFEVCGAHVVKVVVARCEVLEHHTLRVGPRLRTRVLQQASRPEAREPG